MKLFFRKQQEQDQQNQQIVQIIQFDFIQRIIDRLKILHVWDYKLHILHAIEAFISFYFYHFERRPYISVWHSMRLTCEDISHFAMFKIKSAIIKMRNFYWKIQDSKR